MLRVKSSQAGPAETEICDLAARWLSALEELGDRPVPADVLFEVLRMEASEWRAANADPAPQSSIDQPVLLGDDHGFRPV